MHSPHLASRADRFVGFLGVVDLHLITAWSSGKPPPVRGPDQFAEGGARCGGDLHGSWHIGDETQRCRRRVRCLRKQKPLALARAGFTDVGFYRPPCSSARASVMELQSAAARNTPIPRGRAERLLAQATTAQSPVERLDSLTTQRGILQIYRRTRQRPACSDSSRNARPSGRADPSHQGSDPASCAPDRHDRAPDSAAAVPHQSSAW
jgi:hypothetical protein